jgi:hypothetical protein
LQRGRVSANFGLGPKSTCGVDLAKNQHCESSGSKINMWSRTFTAVPGVIWPRPFATLNSLAQAHSAVKSHPKSTESLRMVGDLPCRVAMPPQMVGWEYLQILPNAADAQRRGGEWGEADQQGSGGGK